MKSEQINELAAALSKAQGEFPVLGKGSKAHTYQYADFAETVRAIQDPMQKNGLCLVHEIVGGELPHTVTTLMHTSGQWISTECPLLFTPNGKINAMQALGSAITYAKRYSTCCILNLAADKESDDDGVTSAPVVTTNYKNAPSIENDIESLDDDEIKTINNYLKIFPKSLDSILRENNCDLLDEVPKSAYSKIITRFKGMYAQKMQSERKNGSAA